MSRREAEVVGRPTGRLTDLRTKKTRIEREETFTKVVNGSPSPVFGLVEGVGGVGPMDGTDGTFIQNSSQSREWRFR